MNSFTFKEDWMNKILRIENQEERDNMILLIVRYAFGFEPTNSPMYNEAIFNSIIDDIDAERERKANISAKRKAAGSAGGRQKVANAKQMLSKCQEGSKCLANASIKNNNIYTTTNNNNCNNNCNKIISMDILLQNIFRYNICCNNIGKSLIEDIRSSNEIRYKGLVYLYDAMQKAYAEQDERIKHGMPVDEFVKFMICIDVDLLRYIAMRFTNSPIVSIEFVHQIVKDAHVMSGGKPEVASQILARATSNKQLNLRYGNNKQFTYSNDCSGISSKF